MAEFTASYERKFSDGNYGSEGLSLSWSWSTDKEDEENSSESLSVAADFLRKLVLGELSRSAAERVAWAAKRELNPPASTPRDGVPADAEPASLEDLPF